MPEIANPTVRLAEPGEFDRMVDVERRSGELFTDYGLVLPEDGQERARLTAAEWILVAGRPLIGFAAVSTVDGVAHLEQISVHPDHGRRGIGGWLLEQVCVRVRESGGVAISLTTFRDVPWNGPWYASRGFQELTDESLGLELAAIRGAERAAGLDAVAPRVAMRRAL